MSQAKQLNSDLGLLLLLIIVGLAVVVLGFTAFVMRGGDPPLLSPSQQKQGEKSLQHSSESAETLKNVENSRVEYRTPVVNSTVPGK